MESKAFHFRIGNIECVALSDGEFAYSPPVFPPPADFLFANAPHDLLTRRLKEHQPEPWTEWVSAYTCLLLSTGTHWVLIDTGAGNLGPQTGRLLENLSNEGVHPEDIDLVVLTHGHPDHLGGNTDSTGHLRFPSASWIMSKREWEFWMEGRAEREYPEHLRDVLLGFAHRNLSPLESRCRLLKGEEEVLPGIRVIPAPGHTPGHSVVAVSSGADTLYCVSDLVLHPVHIAEPEWVAAIDFDPGRLVSSRRAFLKEVAQEGALTMAFHFPFPGIGQVLAGEDGWRWRPTA